MIALMVQINYIKLIAVPTVVKQDFSIVFITIIGLKCYLNSIC